MEETVQGLRFAIFTFTMQGVLTVMALSIPKVDRLWAQAPAKGPVTGFVVRLGICMLIGAVSLSIGYFVLLK